MAGFDYSLTVNGREEHFAAAPFMFESRESALAVALAHAADLSSKDRAGEIVILTFAADETGIFPDRSTTVEHHRGPFPSANVRG